MLRDQRGQTLVLALMILFMLVFIGGLFVTMVVKNLSRTERSSQTMTADYLAETGVRYASDQLSFSMDGADWRPVPNYPDLLKCLMKGLPLPPTTPQPNINDPDYHWLMLGFCRFTYGDGRFLIRVTYDPNYGDPISKYIKIECVGRMGIVDENDPTTLSLRQPIRLRAERVAYKSIGITDYSRYITNLERRTEPFALGVPAYTQPDGSKRAFPTQYGVSELDASGNIVRRGGSIHVNGNLMWYGTNFIWLDRLHNESVEVAGDITHGNDWAHSTTSGTPPPDATAVYVNPVASPGSSWQANTTRQSSDPLFDSSPDNPAADVGDYRDGRGEGDVGVLAGTPPSVHHRPRGIQRLDPPLIDATGPAGGVGRYREVTRNSGEWRYSTASNAWYNTGFYGWGNGLYINNPGDIQTESELKTLRDDWMTPGGSQYWNGPYYTPPGVTIILTSYDLDKKKLPNSNTLNGPDMILMQSSNSGAKFQWYNEDGDVVTPSAGQMVMPYPKNGVIYAEGNIRIKGTLPPHTKLTVVSGGTIYVEGSILKCNVDDNGNALPADAPRDSGISLLATDNVCVNTTQFFGPAPETQTSGTWRPDISCFDCSGENPLVFNFAFGLDPTTYSNGTQVPVRAYVRHAADNGPTYMNMAVNQYGLGANPSAPTDAWFGLYEFDEQALATWSLLTPPAAPERKYIYPLADIDAWNQPNTVAQQKYPMWEHQVFPIFPIFPLNANGKPQPQNYALNIFPGAKNLVSFGLDQNMTKSDYLLSRFAIQPCDIRIEALLYAQNGSFYVIPGEWFNPDSMDSRDIWNNSGKADPKDSFQVGRYGRSRIDQRWPFYGDPLDVRIVIYGAVSENIPAPIADEAEWMDKWGWIPPVHGKPDNQDEATVSYRSPLHPLDPEDSIVDSTGKNPIRQRGLSIIYDNQLSYPKISVDPNPLHDQPIRTDVYFRPLPITPKLPVGAQTLYFGEPS